MLIRFFWRTQAPFSSKLYSSKNFQNLRKTFDFFCEIFLFYWIKVCKLEIYHFIVFIFRFVLIHFLVFVFFCENFLFSWLLSLSKIFTCFRFLMCTFYKFRFVLIDFLVFHFRFRFSIFKTESQIFIFVFLCWFWFTDSDLDVNLLVDFD